MVRHLGWSAPLPKTADPELDTDSVHDIPRFLIFFIEQLFLIFNQMLSIRAFGRRALESLKKKNKLVAMGAIFDIRIE